MCVCVLRISSFVGRRLNMVSLVKSIIQPFKEVRHLWITVPSLYCLPKRKTIVTTITQYVTTPLE